MSEGYTKKNHPFALKVSDEESAEIKKLFARSGAKTEFLERFSSFGATEAELNKVIIRQDASQGDIEQAIASINSVLTRKAKGKTKLTKAEFLELKPFDTIFVKGGITKSSTIKTLTIKRQKLESLL